MSKHVFSYHVSNLSQIIEKHKTGDPVQFKDAVLWNRIVTVTRVRPGEPCIFFDQTTHVTITIAEEMPTNKRMIIGTITAIQSNVPLTPTITLVLPILKRDALHASLYAAAQMGIQDIIPVHTERGQSKLPNNKEKLENIMITACEQSKQFIVPKLHEQQTLADAVSIKQNPNAAHICFDEHGETIKKYLCKQHTPSELVIILGPEGGFSAQEHALLEKSSFVFYKLTPTILRSRDAALIGLGALRIV